METSLRDRNTALDQSYWVFSAQPVLKQQGYKLDPPGERIFLSFDHGSYQGLAGVRVVVLKHAQDMLDEDIVVASSSRQQLRTAIRNTQIEVAKREVGAKKNSKSPLFDREQASADNIATLVLLLSPWTSVGEGQLSFPHRIFKPLGVVAPQDSRWRLQGVVHPSQILYSQSYPINHNHRSLAITLDWYGGHSPYSKKLDVGYHFRILPLALSPLRSPHVKQLPEAVVCRIVDYAIGNTWTHDNWWARQVLSYALISRNWLPTTSIFWRYAGTGIAKIYNFPGLATSLQIQPQYRHFIRAFDDALLLSPNKRFGTKLVAPYIAISPIAPIFFAEASLLESIKIHFQSFASAIAQIRALCHIRYLDFIGDKTEPRPRAPPARVGVSRITEILDTIQEWRDLRELKIMGWAWPTFEEMTGPPRSFYGPAAYSLESLSIHHGQLKGAYLLQLFSNPVIRLTDVSLINVNAIYNKDLLAFFKLVAPHLRKIELLRISSCGDPGPGQDLALDATIGDMPNLVEVKTEWALFTNKGISKKAPSFLGSTLHVSDYQYFSIYNSTRKMGFAEALRDGKGKWASIIIMSDGEGGWVETESARASHIFRIGKIQEAANESGVHLSLPSEWLIS